MQTAVKYSKKQLITIMERYALQRLGPHSFNDMPVKFKLEVSQYGSSISCHLRTTEGLIMKVSELTEWFEELPETEQEQILESSRPGL